MTTTASLPGEIVSAIEDVSFMQSIPLWLVSFLGSLFITVMSIILILTMILTNNEKVRTFVGGLREKLKNRPGKEAEAHE